MMPKFENVRSLLFVGLALAAVACAVARIVGVTNADHDVLLFLAAASAFLVLERVRKFSLTKDGLSYELDEIKGAVSDVRQKVAEVRQVSKENQLAITGGVGGK